MISFNHIVAIFDLTMLCFAGKFACAFEGSDGLSVSGGSVGVDHRRSLPCRKAFQGTYPTKCWENVCGNLPAVDRMPEQFTENDFAGSSHFIYRSAVTRPEL